MIKVTRKSIYIIDDCKKQCFPECCNAEIVMDTKYKFMYFRTPTTDIAMNQFQYNFPPIIKYILSSNNSDLYHPKLKKNKKVKIVNNLSQRDNLKPRANKNWGSAFKGKQKDRPSLHIGSKGCLKYHIKGVFYLECHQYLKNQLRSK